MEGYSWNHIFCVFLPILFLGWVFESVYVSVMERRLSNRGFFCGAGHPHLRFWRHDDRLCHNAFSRQLRSGIYIWDAGGHRL